jgi:hypothetical protein
MMSRQPQTPVPNNDMTVSTTLATGQVSFIPNWMHFDLARKVPAMILDKTRFLTKGKFIASNDDSFNQDYSKDTILQ